MRTRKPKQAVHPTSLVLPEEIKSRLLQDKATTGLSVSFLMRQIIIQHYRENKPLDLKWVAS